MSILSQQKQSQAPDFPNIRPSLDLRFALAKKLDPRVTFTRGSTATYIGPDGLIKTAGVNEPRFNHNSVSKESLGLLVEEQRTNLITYSSDYSNAVWIGQGVSAVTTNVATAPDGTLTADKLVGTSGNRVRQSIYQTVNVTSGVKYTFSVFLKAAERRYACIWFDNFNLSEGPYYGAGDYIDLQTGTSTGTATTLVQYPNGWYRLYVSATPTFTGALILNTSIGTPNNYSDTGASNTYKYTGDGTSGIYLWGAQVEAGTFPTSYIPTSSSQVTRSDDTASMTGTNFSSWYNQNQGTIYMETDKVNSGNFDAYRHLYQIDSGSSSDQITVYTIPGATTITNYGITTGGRQVNDYQQINIGSSVVKYKVGQSVSPNYFYFTSSVGRVNPQFPSVLPPNTSNLSLATNMTRLFIGSNSTGGRMNCNIRRFTYYPIQLNNSQLINLTS